MKRFLIGILIAGGAIVGRADDRKPDDSTSNMSGLLSSARPTSAPGCIVIDPELQGSYEGGCNNAGLAEGTGVAKGTAEYIGQFKAGKKHGPGTKTWLYGDRYIGDFVDDHKHGVGTYTWGGKSAWAGERYTGQYRNDKREGQGVYEWPNGDRYEGPWKGDQMTGPQTPMRTLQYQHRKALIEAVAKIGVNVCREQAVGIIGKEKISGVVTAVAENRVGVRISTVGDNFKLINGENIEVGTVIWDESFNWFPCY
ncbi:MAG: hypothetical protein V4568_05110 [Pseudomonadota bacterium]